MSKTFIDVVLCGDGRVRVTANDDDNNVIKTEGVYAKETIELHLGKTIAKATTMGLETLRRLSSPLQNPGAESHFTLDEDGTTVATGKTQVLGIPVGFDDLDKLESLLFQLVPAKEGA